MNSSILIFKKNNTEGQILFTWWNLLQNNHLQLTELIHCKTLNQVFLCQGFWTLYKQVYKKEPNICEERLALIAGLLPKITNHITGISIPQRMAAVVPGRWNYPLVSYSRFMRLLMINSKEDLYKSFSENLRLIRYSADILSLSNDLYNWGESVKKLYAMEYFFKSPETYIE